MKCHWKGEDFIPCNEMSNHITELNVNHYLGQLHGKWMRECPYCGASFKDIKFIENRREKNYTFKIDQDGTYHYIDIVRGSSKEEIGKAIENFINSEYRSAIEKYESYGSVHHRFYPPPNFGKTMRVVEHNIITSSTERGGMKGKIKPYKTKIKIKNIIGGGTKTMFGFYFNMTWT